MNRGITFARAAFVIVLGACSSTPSPSPTATPSLTLFPSPTEQATLTPSASPDATPSGTAAPPVSLAWTEAGRFADEGRAQLVTDVSAWQRGFIAIGQRWPGEYIVEMPEPRIWTSPDGRTWNAVRPNLGASDVELRGILRLSSGGLMLIGARPTNGGASQEARAWTSMDAEQWTAVGLPDGISGTSIDVASGPVGHVIGTGRALWYSAEGDAWQRVYRPAPGIGLRPPAAGDEGFVAPATNEGSGGKVIYASGDGLNWVEGRSPAPIIRVAPWRGDWLGWAYTENPDTISILRSADGLGWSAVLDVNDLTPPDGPKAGKGMESGITEVTLSGEGGVVSMTLGWNHCCAQPPAVVEVVTSEDGASWTTSGAPQETYVTSLATDGEVVVLAGHFRRGRGVAFWVAERSP